MNVNNVGMPSIVPNPLENMKNLTVVRNPLYISKVENHLVFSVTSNI
jgi:hypothetical protein